MSAPKTITVERIRKKTKAKASRDVDIPVEATLVEGRVDLFVRMNTRIAENFSIGLRYHPPMGRSTVIFRWNGDHGRNAHEGCSNRPHVHLALPVELETLPIPTWKDGPPSLAIPLPDDGRSVVWAWKCFLVAAGIQSNAKVDAAIRRLYAEDGQGELTLSSA